MDVLDTLKHLFIERQDKRAMLQRLESLVDALAQKERLVRESTSVRDEVKRHVGEAQSRYKRAIEMLKNQDFDECEELIGHTELHLQLAELQRDAKAVLAIVHPEAADIKALVLLNMMSDGIVQTKLAVEYTNCTVSERVKNGLVKVTSRFLKILDNLREPHVRGVEPKLEANIVRLHWLTLLIALDNRRSIVSIKLNKNVLSKACLTIKDGIERICKIRQDLLDKNIQLNAATETHLHDAESHIRSAIKTLARGDEDAVESIITAALVEARLAERSIPSDTEVSENESTVFSEHVVAKRTATYAAAIEKLKEFYEAADLPNAAAVQKHLTASARYHADASQKLIQGHIQEATRLFRGAYLDLDFAKQLAYSDKPAAYLDS